MRKTRHYVGTRAKQESQLPAREVAICARVRTVRLSVKWSQPNFAKAIGITRERLASYEYGKAPIRYELAKQICFRFNVNHRWLAEGEGAMHEYFEISPHLEHLIAPRMLFSEAYDKVIKRESDAVWKSREALSERLSLPRIGAPERDIILFHLSKTARRHLRDLPEELRAAYFHAVNASAADFVFRHQHEIELLKARMLKAKEVESGETQEAIAVITQELLDISKPPPQSADVQNIRTYGELLDRLRKITKPRGAKSELARAFKVSRQAVDQWLSGDSKPSAEIAIRLLHWKPKLPAK
jgi:transcriptional regulator with XRE-family HTH domain